MLTSLLIPIARGGSTGQRAGAAVGVDASPCRGGTLLVVPVESEAWRESIVRPIKCGGSAVSRALRAQPRLTKTGRARLAGRAAARRGGHRRPDAVDGATILTADHDLLIRREDCPAPGLALVTEVTVTEPIAGNVAESASPPSWAAPATSRPPSSSTTSATRSRSSRQDRHFTIFAWSPCENTVVNAHPFETLLL